MSGNTTVSGSGPITIINGSLNLNGYTLTGTGNTLIFTGAAVTNVNSFDPGHAPPTSGTLDLSAPSSGTWSGVAIYQDPNLTSNVDWTSSGNSLNWDVTGLIYMPNSNINFSGTINKATGGKNCFTLVDYTVQFSGTVKVNEGQTECTAAGLIPPTSDLRRPVLVQ